MTTRTSVAIYARISQDREGAGLGIERQLADCRAEAERMGWTVAEEYVDDDISAYSGKRRPAYERMLEDLQEGIRDAIIVWHIDRLHRRPIELEEFARTCARAGVADLRTVHGEFDLGTGDGMLMARVLAAVAANESDSKRRRGRRKMQEIAEAGRPHGGGTRPFGFQSDRITHDAQEAQIIRTLAERALAGESLTSLGRWLTEEGVTTVTGKEWRTPVIRQLLLNPRIYGVRVHRGQALGPAVWEPIISPERGEALQLLLTNPERRTNRTARRYLLSGMCRCQLCGSVMYSVPRYEERRYLCRSGHDFGGCGRMAISAAPLEQIVSEAVLQRLDSPLLHDALAGRIHDDGLATELGKQIAADTSQLEELTDLYTNRAITPPEWMRARDAIEARRNAARRRLSGLTGTRNLDAYIGNGADLRRQWGELNLDRQRNIVQALVDHVEIMPGTRGTRAVAIERVNPIWRL
ncbi:recombinase family protein [Nocardioides gilvus]|uniref:recombinase family protein n=1 Tax=Nocardioides gilvus TaxID=1735589 RepID=UPI000D74E2A5|nr:recombinase family protein [Nocardioides gilvus]